MSSPHPPRLAVWLVERTLLYGVTPTDPSTYAGVLATLATFGLAACYMPARRGSRLDPKTVLRRD